LIQLLEGSNTRTEMAIDLKSIKSIKAKSDTIGKESNYILIPVSKTVEEPLRIKILSSSITTEFLNDKSLEYNVQSIYINTILELNKSCLQLQYHTQSEEESRREVFD